jgi:hypothetical protein
MNPEFKNNIISFIKKANTLPAAQISSELKQKAMDIIRSKATGFRTGGAAVGGTAGALAGGIGGVIDPDTRIDPRTGQKIRKSRLSSALRGATAGGLVGAGIGAFSGHLARERAINSYYQHDLAPEMLGRIHSNPQVPLNKLEQIMLNDFKNKKIDFADHAKRMMERRRSGEI